MVFKYKSWLKILIGLFLLSITYSALSISNSQLKNKINAIIKKANHNASAGVIIKNIQTGAVLYQKNPDRYFIPASTIKLFTAVTALKTLGESYKFHTQILKRGNNIYVKFSGDPTLTKDDLKNMLAQLKQQGINTIKGNLYIDDTIYDQRVYGPGWMWDELPLCYASPVHAINIDENCFQFQIIPDETAGKKTTLKYIPDKNLIKIDNKIITKNGTEERCYFDMEVNKYNQYFLTGSMKKNTAPYGVDAAVKNIRLYGKNLIKNLLQQTQINLKGTFGFATTPKNSKVLVDHTSEPLPVLLKQMLKKSDNNIADSLYKQVAYKYYKKPATWIRGTKATKEILSKLGIDTHFGKIVDGSGLSRYDLVSPQQLSELLAVIYKTPSWRKMFFTMLPINGTDGSLRYRMMHKNFKGKVFAKTGTMTGVTSLAGFMKTSHGRTLAFVIMFNNFPGAHKEYTKATDKICKVLLTTK